MQLRTILISALISLLTGATFYYLTIRTQKKIAVVDAVKLVNTYKMKQELEAIDQGPLMAMKRQLDSLQLAAENGQKQQLAEAQLQELYKQVAYANNALGQAYQESNTRINEAVWKRLNPLIDAFSEEKGFHLVVGANGMGSVLYNDATYDHTEELIKYVNSRYEQNK